VEAPDVRSAGWRDHAEVRDLIARYCYAIDGRDEAAFGGLWMDDASYDVGGAFGSYTGAEQILRGAGEIWNAFTETHHWTSNVVVSFSDSERASSTSNVLAHLIDTRGMFVLCAADYADQFRRKNGTWFFQERKITIHYLRQVDAPAYG
jgi:hypothetical protein